MTPIPEHASTADIAVVVNGVADLAAIGAAWNLVKSGRVRLSAPTVTQLQAEGQAAPAEQPEPVTDISRRAS